MYLRSIDVSWYGIILLAIIAASAVQAVYGNMQLWEFFLPTMLILK
jgi:hypothetical protein